MIRVFVSLAALATGLEVPVFPLRKPRFPTETLRLNLFEPRYLNLARSVTSAEDAVFAAMYCGDVPSVLPRGDQPPTPLLAPDAVGVLCEVTNSETLDSGRVALRATAFSRCKLVSVLSSPATGGREPYVVVDAEPLLDDLEPDAAEKERETARAVADVEHLLDKLWGPFNSCETPSDDDDDDALRYDAVRRFAPNLVDDECVVAELERQYCLVSGACGDFAPTREELYSFSLLSTLDLAPRDKQLALESTNTLDRFRHVFADLRRGRNWLAARAALTDLRL
ncbi:hypothetical protein CTAYLR_009015 [Chrysophaeum taylorii]|uniref:Lon N-terminal domain-containing protein n=1 Tax=Chrysophaeum taylorii TaxID=2483200 RepID=A0AAD7XQM6_9STRA|nr:hypothetical protein CTAYLR_009015 [Chrysophaeum taylorii]